MPNLKKMRKLTSKAKMIAAVAALAFMTACASNTGSLESCTAPPQYTTEQMEQAWAESQAVPEDGMMMMIFFDMLDWIKKYHGGTNDTP